MKEVEFEIVFVTLTEDGNKEVPFKGTAAEIAREVQLRQVIYGTCAYYIPLKVGIITEEG